MVDSNLAATALDAIRTMIPDTNAQIQYAGDNDALDGTIAEAICVSVENMRAMSEQGNYNSKECIVRYKLADEPDEWGIKLDGDETTPGTGKTNPAIMGDLIDVLLPGDTEWDDAVRARVQNRIVMAGMVRLNLIGEHEEI